MSQYHKLYTPADTAVVFIDHQPQMTFGVLEAQQDLYPTQRAQTQAQVGELLAMIQLYRALGGGWQEELK